MANERITVRIRGILVSLPVYETEENTRRIAAVTEKALNTVEEEGGPINSLSFALRVACDARFGLEELKRERDAEVRDLLRGLSSLQRKLDHMEGKLDPDG